MFADERTISEIIGKPPISPASAVPTPVARRSRLMSVRSLIGSSDSTAFALSIDSIDPTSANITMNLIDVADVMSDQSGNTIAFERCAGSVTSERGPTT
jgi:hypothetical protein